MSNVVVFDSLGPETPDADTLRAALRLALQKRHEHVGWTDVSAAKLGHCIGCFDCFARTPGVCRFKQDEGPALLRQLVHCDLVIRLTTLSFGGYNSAMKLVLDRSVPAVLPFFEMSEGDTHHVPRYAKRPRCVSIGLAAKPDEQEAALFKTLCIRNALNFAAPSFAAEVLNRGEAAEQMAEKIEQVLLRNERPLDIAALGERLPRPSLTQSTAPKRALLINASPKTQKASSSERMNKALLHHLESHGCAGELITLNASLQNDKGRERFLSQVAAADLLVLTFPLFVDSLPFLPTRALEILAAATQTSDAPKKKITAIINCGFPEAHQNSLAAAIVAHFARQAGYDWAGALLVGGGEGVVSGREVPTDLSRARPPVAKVAKALAAMGEALAKGRAVPDELAALMAQAPLPIPFSWWRKLYLFIGDLNWKIMAKKSGAPQGTLYARPYAD